MVEAESQRWNRKQGRDIMHMTTCPVSLLLCVSMTVFAQCDRATAGDGYTYPLFDGKSLDGWTIENGCEATAEDGTIRLTGGNGWLRSDYTYADFQWHVEWKALQAENYDAGLFIRTLPGGSPFPQRGYQANLLQGQEGNIGNLQQARSSGLVHPVGEWNAFDFTVAGTTVQLAINGQRAYEADGITIPSGYLGIQVEVPKGGQFLLRNLRVTELGYRDLLKGEGFGGWEGAGLPADLCWERHDGALVGLKKKGPWLRSREQFDDFDLRLEYQVEPGSNSGIYLRVPADGNHHRDDASQPPAGIEVQILDDGAAKYRRLKDYQACGSLYDLAPAMRHVGRPPGRWNTLEINCRGPHIACVHNGVVVVDADPEQFPLLTLRQRAGYLGLQNHGGGVTFRRLRIGPPRQP